MECILSGAADQDIFDIYTYTYFEFGEAQARAYCQALEKKFHLLIQNPKMYPLREEFNPPVYIAHQDRHIIIYSIAQSNILIVRVLHDSMDVIQHL